MWELKSAWHRSQWTDFKAQWHEFGLRLQRHFLVSIYWGRRTDRTLIGSCGPDQGAFENKLVGTFGIAAALLIAVSMFTSGDVAIWSLVLCGFFNSIMFPNIFTPGALQAWGPMI